MKIRQADLKNDFLGFFSHDFVQVTFNLVNHLFNSCWMNSTVLHQPFEGNFCNFPTQWIKSLKQSRLQGVSSMMRSTPVAASNARMFRPSRPMIRPFMPSLAKGTTEIVASLT